MTIHILSRRQALVRAAYLLGGTLSATTVAGVLAGCDRSRAGTGPLSDEEREMLAVISERIIPRTDTPGAREAGVPEFIEVMLTEYYPDDERELFLSGLRDVDEQARSAHGEPFMDCTPEQQIAVLTAIDRDALTPKPPDPPPQENLRDYVEPGAGETPLPPELERDTIKWIWGEPKDPAEKPELPFWRTMKELTLVGYYTSEPGATQELRYEPVPGRFEGCIPFSQVGRAWAV